MSRKIVKALMFLAVGVPAMFIVGITIVCPAFDIPVGIVFLALGFAIGLYALLKGDKRDLLFAGIFAMVGIVIATTGPFVASLR